ncbi:MAG: branched-chain amino acid ABC transporter substrate-binding protein [bacterium]
MLSIVALIGCSSPPPVTIGIVLNRDGERGALLAVDDVNAAGGIRGRRLELRIMKGSSSTAARDALVAAESLALDPAILGVVGHTNSAASLAASQVYNEHHIVQIAPTTTAPLYSSAGPYSFRMVASDAHQGAFLARLVAADPAHPRTAVLYVNDDYGRALHGTFAQNLSLSGATLVYEAPFEEGVRFVDVATMAQAIAHTRPDLLVWLGRPNEFAALIPSLRALAPSIRVLASDGLSNPEIESHPAPAFLGVTYVRFRDLANSTPAIRLLDARFRDRWHDAFTDQYCLAYDAVRLLAEATSAGGSDRAAVQRYLTSLGRTRPPFQGVLGKIAFDEHGDPNPAYFLAQVTASGSKATTFAAWSGSRQ